VAFFSEQNCRGFFVKLASFVHKKGKGKSKDNKRNDCARRRR
jgi:hypothetical protein